MNAEATLTSDDFQKCADFHGHVCPGLAIGYKASKAGLDWLEENRSEDEEIVAIVETDACCVDAVQVLTGCTFGKGNFIYKDHGKLVFTFVSRNSGKGVRIAMKPVAREISDSHRELIDKVRSDEATPEEKAEFKKLHLQRSEAILASRAEDLFSITEVVDPMPEKAQVEPSVECSRCGEPTMASKVEEVSGQPVCRGCLSKA